ncbi:WS/DGAT domain-containing protein [Streptomyces sp. URMC 123]|uniref:WS/DGAT domain-containing protein n=1 Tax=Streptomyces sp. URMC 123 TaxID=3423403 RepID=UPI003F1B522D
MAEATTGRAPGSSPFDRGWYQYEKAYPHSSVAIGAALLCTGETPSRDDLRLLLTMGVEAYPGLGGGSAPGSTDSVDDHLFEHRTPPGSGDQGLRDALDAVSAQPLPAVPWGIWIVHGYAPGRFAFVVRFHHGHTDGALLSEFGDRLLAGAAGRPGGRPREPVRGRPPRTRLTTALREGRELLDGPRPACHPLPRGAIALTGRPHYCWGAVDLDRLRRIAGRYDATVNDLYLTALAGALRAWAPDDHWLRGSRPVRAHVYINLRRGDSGGRMGNQLTGTQVRLPCRETDPVRRLAEVRRRTDRIRSAVRSPDVGSLTRLLPARFGLLLLLLGLHPSRVTLLATRVPGPRQRMSLFGRTVTEMVPLVFLPAGQALSVCLGDYGDTACVSFVVDRAVAGGEELPRLWLREIDRLERAAGPTARPPTRRATPRNADVPRDEPM